MLFLKRDKENYNFFRIQTQINVSVGKTKWVIWLLDSHLLSSELWSQKDQTMFSDKANTEWSFQL